MHVIGSSEAGNSEDQDTLTSASVGRLFDGMTPGKSASKIQSEPSFWYNFPAFFFLHKYQFASSPPSISPHLLYTFSIRLVPMADLRLRSLSSSPKPLTKKVADGYSVASTPAPPQTHLLTRLLYVTSAILSISCLVYASGRGREHLPDAYALCSRSGAYIYTVDPDYPRAQCMVVQGSYIVDVGAIGM